MVLWGIGNTTVHCVACFTFSTTYSQAPPPSQSYIDLFLHNPEYFVLAHHPSRYRFSFHKSKNIRTNPAKIPPKPPQTFPPLKKFSAACKNCGILSLLYMGDIKALPSQSSANESVSRRRVTDQPVQLRRWVQTNPSSLFFFQRGEAVITRTIHAISKTSSRPVRRARKLHTTKAVQQTDCACNPGRHKKTSTTKSAE